MTKRVREWYLFYCNKKNIKPSVKGLIDYWNIYKIILEPIYYYSGKQLIIGDKIPLRNNDIILSKPY